MSAAGEWSATIQIRRADAVAADRLVAALVPEAAREVPRTRARIERVGAGEVSITLTARDTGALRAAFNTYLGWIALTTRTEAVARSALAGRAPRP
jgi:tRNA threonylcarbamoyladenosine modification (KEOPS) complex  Pcc1 subunit